MNLIIASGRMVRNPEMRQSKKSGRLFCSMRMAIIGDYRGKETGRETDFVDVLAFGEKAKTMHRNLRKGTRVLITGSLRTFERVDPYGQTREAICIMARSFEMIDSHETKEPIEDLADSSGNLLIPKEITDSLIRQVDYKDEDMPIDYIERSADDLLQG